MRDARRVTRRLNPKDRARITCQDCLSAPADVCVTVYWNTGNTDGVSFFYHCDDCERKRYELTKQGITRTLVSNHGLTPAEASELVTKHEALITDATILYNAERILEAEAASLPTPAVQDVEEIKAAPTPEAPTTPANKSKAQQNLRPFIRLGPNLVPLHSDKEVKQMQKQGFEIIYQAETEG